MRLSSLENSLMASSVSAGIWLSVLNSFMKFTDRLSNPMGDKNLNYKQLLQIKLQNKLNQSTNITTFFQN